MKKIILFIISLVFIGVSFANSQKAGWSLIPEGDAGNASSVGNAPGAVWEQYRSRGSSSTPGDSFASGVFSWKSIFKYFQYLAQTLSQIGLIVGAVMIIYAGYKYATGVFTGDASKGGQDAIKSAIYGVLIVIFSYAIMKLLISTFL